MPMARTRLRRMEGGRLPFEVLKGGNSGKRVEEEEVEEEELLKREIKRHPMFGILKDTHLHCLKVCSGDEEMSAVEPAQIRRSKSKQEDHSDLDLFMQGYRAALVELAWEIQKPMQEAAAFTELMYRLLDGVAAADPSPASGGAATGSTDK